MIHSLTVIPTWLDFLDTTHLPFYLSGSRYFQCERPDSDWDFIGQDSPVVREFLKENGFESLLGQDYSGVEVDEITADILAKDIGGVEVQVQLAYAIEFKVMARDLIHQRAAGYHQDVRDHRRTALWNFYLEKAGWTAEERRRRGIYRQWESEDDFSDDLPF